MSDLHDEYPEQRMRPTADVRPVPDPTMLTNALVNSAVGNLEARILTETLDACKGNKAAAARALHIDYTTMHRKLKRYGFQEGGEEP